MSMAKLNLSTCLGSAKTHAPSETERKKICIEIICLYVSFFLSKSVYLK